MIVKPGCERLPRVLRVESHINTSYTVTEPRHTRLDREHGTPRARATSGTRVRATQYNHPEVTGAAVGPTRTESRAQDARDPRSSRISSGDHVSFRASARASHEMNPGVSKVGNVRTEHPRGDQSYPRAPPHQRHPRGARCTPGERGATHCAAHARAPRPHTAPRHSAAASPPLGTSSRVARRLRLPRASPEKC